MSLHVGDALTVLRTLPAASVQTCVTSPPYWGLRDYGTAAWEGGAEDCDHRHESKHQQQGATSARAGRANVEEQRNENFRDVCGRCGARRIDAQLGLEPTPEAYVAALVDVFREVRRVLRDDGTLWLNLGDSYTSGGRKERDPGQSKIHPAYEGEAFADGLRPGTPDGLKPKDLVGIPWRVAFALQADGWYLRSDIIWAKPNPMPESVTDRPTKAHEYIFLLAKSERYYYDAAAIAERATYAGKVVTLGEKSLSRGQANGAGIGASGNGKADTVTVAPDRNRRSVWTVATQPYPEAHFATFPPDLIKPCILAGSRPGDAALDPFAGAGTTLYVAKELGRKWVGIELNPEYIALAEARMRQEVLPL